MTLRKTQGTKLDLACYRNDFEGFCGRLDIVPREGYRQKLLWTPIQRRYCAARTSRDIILKARQIGFTTLELARDLWFFLTRRGARVVVVCQSSTERNALTELSDKLRIMIDSLQEEGAALDFRTETISSWVLGDSSLRIVQAGASEAAAAKKGRSGTLHRLHITELAFFEFAQTTLNAMLECVPGPEYGTEIVSESTANGAAGVFYEQYRDAKEGKSGYKAHFFPWLEQAEYATPLALGEHLTPESDRERELLERHGATPEQVKWYRQKLASKGGDKDLTDQEYPADEETCWRMAGRTFFDRDITKALLGKTIPPVAIERGGRLRVWKRAEPRRQYLVTADPSEGTGGDPGAAVVHDGETGEHVATLHGQFPPWQMGAELSSLGLEYNEATVAVERNNHGHAVLQSLEHGDPDAAIPRKPYRNIYDAEDGKAGWYSTAVRRAAALDALDGAHRGGEWGSPDRTLVAEFLTFVVNKDGKAAAAPGAYDDILMAAAIANDILSRPTLGVRAPRTQSNRWGNRGRGY